MTNSEKKLTCEQARNYDIVDYLSALGFSPVKNRGNNYWYLSPFRAEKTASFKVERKLNRWIDFGEGKGGNLIDFAIAYHNCTVGEFLQILSCKSVLPKRETIPYQIKNQEGKIVILKYGQISHPSLIFYLQQRRIPFQIAVQYYKEVHFELYGKTYFSLGLQNDKGGFELRNSFFKGSSSPKTFTSIINNRPSDIITVFEGGFNFLSYLYLLPENDRPNSDYMILNSLVFFEKARLLLESYKQIHLFLDNDPAGRKVTQYALCLNTAYQDKSHLYKNHKDLNDFLCQFGLDKTKDKYSTKD